MMALKRRNEELEKELSQLWELYTFLQTRPLPEAQQILNRMRSSADLLAVLQFVKDGDLLIQMASRSQSDLSSPSLPEPSPPMNLSKPPNPLNLPNPFSPSDPSDPSDPASSFKTER